MTKTWNGPTPYDASIEYWGAAISRLAIAQQEAYRTAKNDDMAIYEALRNTGDHFEETNKALAAYETGLRETE